MRLKVALSLLVAVIGFGPTFASAQNTSATQLTPNEMRLTAVNALKASQSARALALSEALLVRDPNDPIALELAARAALDIENSEVALRHARSLFRTAETEQTRFRAARIAALANVQLDRLTSAQVWLRRARQFSPNAENSAEIARDYNAVRQQNSLSFDFDFGISPSSNINNGSSEETFDINLFGSLITLPFDESLKDLSGYEVSAAARLRYRLNENATRQTSATFGLQTSQFFLSPESRDLAPNFDASTLNFWRASTGLNHVWLVGENNELATASLNYGITLVDGDLYASDIQLGFGRQWRVRDNAVLSADTVLGKTLYRQTSLSSENWSAALGYRQRFNNGQSMSVSVNTGRSLSDASRYAYTFQSIGAEYDFGSIAGRLDVAVNGDYSLRHYGNDSSGSVVRFDQTAKIGVSVGFPEMEVYGFEPIVTVLGERTISTSERYQTETLSVDLSFRSSF